MYQPECPNAFRAARPRPQRSHATQPRVSEAARNSRLRSGHAYTQASPQPAPHPDPMLAVARAITPPTLLTCGRLTPCRGGGPRGGARGGGPPTPGRAPRAAWRPCGGTPSGTARSGPPPACRSARRRNGHAHNAIKTKPRPTTARIPRRRASMQEGAVVHGLWVGSPEAMRHG